MWEIMDGNDLKDYKIQASLYDHNINYPQANLRIEYGVMWSDNCTV